MSKWIDLKRRLVNEKIPTHAEGEKVCRQFTRDYPEVKGIPLEVVEEAEAILFGIDMGLRPKQATWDRYIEIRPQALDCVLDYDLSELRVWMFLRSRYISQKANKRWRQSERGKEWQKEWARKQREIANLTEAVEASSNGSIIIDD